MSRNDSCDIDVYVVYETEGAILVNENGGKDGVWLPLSQVTNYDAQGRGKIGEWMTISAPEWLLEDRDLL
jgi:hypothetical protein